MDDLDFENPPLNELIVGCYFAPILPLRAEHVGLFWQQIIDKYPKSQQAQPIGISPIESEGEFLPMPRFWFISEDDAWLVQIQKDAVLLNWRRRPTETEYPHFNNVFTRFNEVFDAYRLFLLDQLQASIAEVRTFELTYANTIAVPANAVLAEGARYLPILENFLSAKGSEQLRGINVIQLFQASNRVRVEVHLRNVKHEEPNKQALYLEIKARGLPKDRAVTASKDWFTQARQESRAIFVRMTSDWARKEVWKEKSNG